MTAEDLDDLPPRTDPLEIRLKELWDEITIRGSFATWKWSWYFAIHHLKTNEVLLRLQVDEILNVKDGSPRCQMFNKTFPDDTPPETIIAETVKALIFHEMQEAFLLSDGSFLFGDPHPKSKGRTRQIGGSDEQARPPR